MRALAALFVLAACGPSPRPAPLPEPVANVVPDAGADEPAESGEGSEADRWVARGEALRIDVFHDPTGEGSAQAVVLFRQACDQDHPRGCELLAETLKSWQHYGVLQDEVGATRAFHRACQLEQAAACYFYGFYVLEGIIEYLIEDGELREAQYGVDDYFALELIQKACDLGLARACDRIQEEPRLH